MHLRRAPVKTQWRTPMTQLNSRDTGASQTATSGEEHLYWMAEALREADAAAEAMDVPVGCVIVGATGVELGRGCNRRERDQDPTAHAEIIALRKAAAQLNCW